MNLSLQALLPCSQNVCKEHVEKLVPKESGQKFKCFICNHDHQVPFEGFIFNQMASQMINMNVHLNENTKKVAELVSNLQVELDQLDTITNNPDVSYLNILQAFEIKLIFKGKN